MKFFQAVQLGFQILAEIESLMAGGTATMDFSYKGKRYVITIKPR